MTCCVRCMVRGSIRLLASPWLRVAAAGMAVGLLAIPAVGCRRGADSGEVEPPGEAMECGIRGHMLNIDGTPQVHARIAGMSLDRQVHVSSLTDEMGRFALATECRRLYSLAVRGSAELASAWVWVDDAVVDVAVTTPADRDRLDVKAVAPEDAARLRLFAISPPTLTPRPRRNADKCARAIDELTGIGDASHEASTRQLARLAALEGRCGACPGPTDAAALAGSLTAGRGVAEAWNDAYGRLFACSPGAHPHEAAFATVLAELPPELAARVVLARLVEAETQHDTANAARLRAMLQAGALAETAAAQSLP